MLRLLLIVPLVFCAGCVPAVIHGPNVEEGWKGGGIISFGRASLDNRSEYPEILPATAVFLRRGWSVDSTRGEWGKHIGLQVSPFALLAAITSAEDRAVVLRALEGDLYIQVPSGAHRGIGITASRYSVMPYMQFGRARAAGDSWYTTQGVAAVSSGNYELVFWSPMLALREVSFRGRSAVHFQLSGAFGYSKLEQHGVRPATWDPMWMISGGIGLEIGGSR